ncbi:MAG: transcription antitermination factor NusB [Treponema sp.]|nr:transcription antitermination factor NusB [Treponema sp.]
MASRRKGRILAFQALYFWESSAAALEDLVSFSWLGEEKLKSLNEDIALFSRALIAGTIENIDVIDKMLKSHLENWDISRLNRVDLAILRMSVYSLMFQSDMPPSIVIDEAIGICKEFGADDSFKFVNGVLDNIRKTVAKQAEK